MYIKIYCISEECYKDCGAHGRLEDRNCICNQGWSGDLCHIQGIKSACSNIKLHIGLSVLG